MKPVTLLCPVCGHVMEHLGVLLGRSVQTWTCGSKAETHQVTVRLRGKAMIFGEDSK